MTQSTTPGQRFRAARIRAALSQTEVARATGQHQPDISAFEMGKKSVSLERLHEWCLACGIDPHEVDERLSSTV
jgi:transcriptional regulator with XRE-family HTH domain